jgi:hypothetical protein
LQEKSENGPINQKIYGEKNSVGPLEPATHGKIGGEVFWRPPSKGKVMSVHQKKRKFASKFLFSLITTLETDNKTTWEVLQQGHVIIQFHF